MRVERFFLFFGPTIWSFKRGETEYGVKSIPLGGYVKITGMNPEEEIPPEVAHRAYYRQTVWKRIVVVAAGPAVNIVLAFAILFGVSCANGQEATAEGRRDPRRHRRPRRCCSRATESSPSTADAYPGLGTEERLERFGEDGRLARVRRQAGRRLRGGDAGRAEDRPRRPAETISVKPDTTPKAKRALVGFSYGSERPTSAPAKPPARPATRSGKSPRAPSTSSPTCSKRNSASRSPASSASATSPTRRSTKALERSLLLLALVSLSLGLINLLPILPLDGGHIFWSVVEKLRGRPVSLRVMERASVIGFALVMMLFVLGLSNDIGRITGDGFEVR